MALPAIAAAYTEDPLEAAIDAVRIAVGLLRRTTASLSLTPKMNAAGVDITPGHATDRAPSCRSESLRQPAFSECRSIRRHDGLVFVARPRHWFRHQRRIDLHPAVTPLRDPAPRGSVMTDYVILFPADSEAEWDQGTEADHQAVYENDNEFGRLLEQRGGRITGGAELASTRRTRVVRRGPNGTRPGHQRALRRVRGAAGGLLPGLHRRRGRPHRGHQGTDPIAPGGRNPSRRGLGLGLIRRHGPRPATPVA
jgi:hypothetical protein